MSFLSVRNAIDHVSRRRRSSPSQSSEVSENDASSDVSASTKRSSASSCSRRHSKPPSDDELLRRARDIHSRIDFESLSAGPGKGGPWQRVEAADRFVVFRRQDSKAGGNQDGFDGVEDNNSAKLDTGPEVLCAGRMHASIEEVASVLNPTAESEHQKVMAGLYAKRFIFGSVERRVPCTRNDDTKEEPHAGDNGERLTVKTTSFGRTSLLASNEQWCYLDFFQPKQDRDGFTISQRSLEHHEHTPGRAAGAQGRVDQLHDLAAAYLVDLDPGGKGLRVVFNAKFAPTNPAEVSNRDSRVFNRSSLSVGSNASLKCTAGDTGSDVKAQNRRLLALAHGVTNLPDVVRRRRFGYQIPADLDAIQVSNPRCPCCTRSLAPIKMSLGAAATAISRRSFTSLRVDTRRCFLCGYLVCIDCWSVDRMENAAGRVANTIVCTRCEASVDACNYSAISVDQQHRGPARVVPDPPESDTVSLLVDFLAASLNQAPPGSSEHSHVINVVRTLLKQNKNQVSDDDDDDEVEEEDDAGANDCISAEEQDALARVEEFLADERNFPPLIKCTFNNTKRRNYVLNLPENPKTEVPSSPIPDNEASRLSAAEAAGLIQLANYLAPEHPTAEAEPDHVIDVHDLDIICQLAAKTLGVTHALISVMGANHEHVLASVGTPKFAGAAVPRQHTLCQHQLMAPGPLMLVHPEADLRLQNIETIKNLGPKCYIGFPVTAPTIGDGGREQIAVGTLCCFDSEPRSELTHTQYATLQSLARTASYLVQRKGQQIQQQVAQESRES